MPAMDDSREEMFIQLVFDHWSQRAAYREAFPLSRKWRDKTVDVRASQLFNKDKVQIRLHELKAQARELYEAEAREKILSVVDRMLLLSQIAQSSASDKARISAVDTLNKMDGVYVSKLELTAQKADMDRMDDILAQMGMLDE